MRRSLSLLAIAFAAFLLLPSGSALAAELEPDVASAEAQFLDLINASRALDGAGELVINTELSDIARGWSAQMDAAGSLSHNPDYTRQYSGVWNGMAENVGYMQWPGGDVEEMVASMHQRFLDSSGHRRNLMKASYNQVGIGVVLSGDFLWVTVNFLNGPLPQVLDFHQDTPELPAAVTYQSRR